MTCIGGNGTCREAMGPHAMLADATWHCPMALPPCHVTNPSEGLHTTSRPLTKLV
jgi:hypothetical protein